MFLTVSLHGADAGITSPLKINTAKAAFVRPDDDDVLYSHSPGAEAVCDGSPPASWSSTMAASPAFSSIDDSSRRSSSRACSVITPLLSSAGAVSSSSLVQVYARNLRSALESPASLSSPVNPIIKASLVALQARCDELGFGFEDFIIQLSRALDHEPKEHHPSHPNVSEHKECNGPLMWCTECKKQTTEDRILFVLVMLDYVLQKFTTEEPIHIISFGAGYCLQAFLEIYGLVLLGYKNIFVCPIDPITSHIFSSRAKSLAAIFTCRLRSLKSDYDGVCECLEFTSVADFIMTGAVAAAAKEQMVIEFVDADVYRPKGVSLPPGYVYKGETDFKILVDEIRRLQQDLTESKQALVLTMINCVAKGIRYWPDFYDPEISTESKLVSALVEQGFCS